ncbi:MAG: periplasmic heavy metal sensor [Oleispira sp.]|nr:periplasmic heavy metal sensor [Oleispira sp.]MBL4882628.1 periplasmic heavy metal sensor [Oleispira sp.]
MNKKMKIFISTSVLLNVLLVGVVVGGISKSHFIHGYQPERMERLAEILAVLPAEKSKEFELRISNMKALKRADKVSMKSARKNVMQVFTQEPFDKMAYQQAVQGLNKLHQQQMEKRVNLMADMAQYLSPKERKQLSHFLMRRGRRK